MKVTFKIENGIDATGVEKRTLWVAADTENPGLGLILAVNELEEGSILAKEIDRIVGEMIEKKHKQVVEDSKKKTKKLLDKRKKDEKRNVL